MPTKRLECFYGDSGTGKSEAAAEVGEAVALETGKGIRALIGDGSKSTYEDRGLVEAGVAEVIDYTVFDYPQSTLQQLMEGWWLEEPDNPKKGLVKPDPNGTPVQKEMYRRLLNTGTYIIEGIAVMGLYYMGDAKGALAYRSGQGEKIGQDSPIRVGDGEYDKFGKFIPAFDGAVVAGANPPSHYQVAQRRLLTYIDRSKTLPMEFVIWTSHQRAVEEKLSKEIVVGPEAPGGALTAGLQRLFNNTLHFVHAAKRVKGVKDDFTGKQVDDLDLEYRIYTRDHYAVDGNVPYKFKAVTRALKAGKAVADEDGSITGMPQYLTGEPGQAIMQFYSILKQARAGRVEATKAKFAEAQARRSGKEAA
jgi:hypothetical protein